MALFSFLDGVRLQAKRKGYRIYIDNIGIDSSKTGLSANVDGISADSNRHSKFRANIDGIGINRGRSGVNANVGGVGFNSNNGKKLYAFVDGVKMQTTLDNVLSRFSTDKLKKMLGLHKNWNYRYAIANLFTIFEQLRSGNRMTLSDIWSIFSGQPSQKKVPKSFGDFVRDWARSGMNPIKYIYNQFTKQEHFDIETELVKQLKFGKFEPFTTEQVIRQLLESRVQNADNVELDNKLSRRITKPEDLHSGMDRFNQIYGDRMRNIAEDLVEASKGFQQLSRTQQKALINTFKDRMRSEIRKTVLGGFIFGAGGLQRLTAGHLSSMSRVLNEQYRFLDGFVADLYAFGEQGKEINANAVERAGRYANVLRQAYYTSYQQKAIETYGSAFYEKRVLSPAENCPDCIEYAEQGCQPQGTLPLPTIGSACMNNCKCEYLVFEGSDMCNQSMESFATDGEE